MEFQTRSEVTGVIQHKSLADALTAIHTDETIWKISFTDENGERHRIVREFGGWTECPLMDEVKKGLERK